MFIQPPGPSLSSKRQVQTSANQEREGIQRQGRSSQETIVKSRDRSWFPSRDSKHSKTLELLCRHWTPHQVGEVNSLLPTSMETPDLLEQAGWWCWLPLTLPPASQKNVQNWPHPLWTIITTLLTTLSRRDTQLWVYLWFLDGIYTGSEWDTLSPLTCGYFRDNRAVRPLVARWQLGIAVLLFCVLCVLYCCLVYLPCVFHSVVYDSGVFGMY